MKKIFIFSTFVLFFAFGHAQVSKLDGNFEWAGITTQGWKVVDVKPTLQGGYAINKTWGIGLVGTPMYNNTPTPAFTLPPDGDPNNKKNGAFYNGGGNSTDSWLISPKVENIEEGDYLCFWIDNSIGGPNYNLDVLISTTDDKVESFTKEVISFKQESIVVQNWKFYSFSLADYIGKDIYIAFRIYYEGYDFGGAIQIDNVTVGTVSMPDISIVEILYPEIPMQNVTDSVEITLVVKNIGLTITSFDMWYVRALANSYDYTQHCKIERELKPLDTAHVSFPRKEWFTLGKRDTLTVFLGIANDVDRSNDTIEIIVDNVTPGQIPYVNGFETPDEIAGMKIYNVLRDESTWVEDLNSAAYARKGAGSLRYSGNPNTDANDWIFTKLIHFPTAATYELTFWYGTTDETQPQELNVMWTKAQKYQEQYAMWYLMRYNNIINKIPQNNLETRGYEQAVARFNVETPGNYFIGFHCLSPKTTTQIAYLYVDDLKIDYAVGIEEIEKPNEVIVFPNPANVAIQIQGEYRIEQVDIYNVLGQKVATQQFDTRYASMDVKHLADGLYIVKVKTEKGELTKKINIVQ